MFIQTGDDTVINLTKGLYWEIDLNAMNSVVYIVKEFRKVILGQWGIAKKERSIEAFDAIIIARKNGQNHFDLRPYLSD